MKSLKDTIGRLLQELQSDRKAGSKLLLILNSLEVLLGEHLITLISQSVINTSQLIKSNKL